MNVGTLSSPLQAPLATGEGSIGSHYTHEVSAAAKDKVLIHEGRWDTSTMNDATEDPVVKMKLVPLTIVEISFLLGG